MNRIDKITREKAIFDNKIYKNPRIITSGIGKSVIFYTDGNKDRWKLNVVRETKHIAPLSQAMMLWTSQITDLHTNKGYMYDFTDVIFEYNGNPLDNMYEVEMHNLIKRFDGYIYNIISPTMKRNYMSNYFPVAMDNIYGYAFILSGIYYAYNQNNEEGTVSGTFKGEIFKDMIWKTIDMNREIRDGKAADNLFRFYRQDECYLTQTIDRIQESIDKTNKKKDDYRY